MGIFIRFLASLTLTALLASPIHVLAAQDAAPIGRVTGRVVDAASGAGLSDVTLRVVGANLGTISGVNGQFTLTNVPAGTVGITARRLGFAAKTVTGIQVAAGRTAEQNVSLTASTVQLEAVTVSATTERGSVSDALDAQRSSSGVVKSSSARASG